MENGKKRNQQERKGVKEKEEAKKKEGKG